MPKTKSSTMNQLDLLAESNEKTLKKLPALAFDFATELLAWFDQKGRHDLPWQHNKTPYRVWVSEIMLQQTQVTTVIPYYEKFMQSFPSVEALAGATQDEVLSHWSGLGYYARGRNLHKTAQIVVSELGGEFPQDLEGMIALPGIGRSTAGAVLAIACQQRQPILDGNVKRVLCRFDAVESWSGNKQTEAILWQRADALTPQQRFDDYTQAIMDLGATVCKRSKPLCIACPMQANCDAFAQNRVKDFPYSKPKKAKPTKHTCVLILMNAERKIWMQQRPQKGIWGGLWSLPECQKSDLEHIVQNEIECDGQVDVNLVEWSEFKHTFTHYHLMIQPVVVEQVTTVRVEGEWVTVASASERGLPAPIRKVIEVLEE